MTIARKEVVFDGDEGVYHCINRCVRRAFLTGVDKMSGNNYDHRKEWIYSRLVELSEIFAVEICGYAVMSNHLHVVLRNRPDILDGFSDCEVAERWSRLYPKQFKTAYREIEAEAGIALMCKDSTRMKVLRERLGSISWVMKCLSEPISHRANKEDGCKGRFWEGRFKCQALLDEAAVLTCMAYVDLNPIRAGVARTPETSEYTSAHERIEAHKAEKSVEALEAVAKVDDLSEKQKEKITEEKLKTSKAAWLSPLDNKPKDWKQGIHGLLGMSLSEYLELLDWTGRCIHRGKRGVIPANLKPILERISIDVDNWVDSVLSFGKLFYRAVGQVEKLVEAAKKAGKKWLHGVRASHKCFPVGT